MAREHVTQGISFSPDLLERAKARAAGKQVSLSTYIQQLVLADLEQPTVHLEITTLVKIAEHLAELAEIKKHYIQFTDTEPAVAEDASTPRPSRNSTPEEAEEQRQLERHARKRDASQSPRATKQSGAGSAAAAKHQSP